MQPPRDAPIEVRLPAAGVFVLESRHAPGFRMPEQRHDFWEFFYVLAGRGRFWFDGSPHPCRAGEVVIVPAGSGHRVEDDTTAPLALYAVCVAPRLWADEPGLFGDRPEGALAVAPALAARLRADLRRLLFEQTQPGRGGPTLVRGLTLQLLAELARARVPAASAPAPSAGAEAVRRYVERLSRNFLDAGGLDDAAEELGMSRRRLTQLFRQLTGTSRDAYLTGLRIDYACRLLRDTNRSITAISFESGYEDLSSFYRAFKRHTGRSPHAWRKGAGR